MQNKKYAKDENGRFAAGNCGGGRPIGGRAKLSEAFLADLLEDWQAHGKEVIAQVRAEKPEVYLKIVSGLLPKDLNITKNGYEDLSDEELIQVLRETDESLKEMGVFDDDANVIVPFSKPAKRHN